MVKKIGCRPAEIFGFPIWNHSEEAQQIRELHWCPFLNRKCEKKSCYLNILLDLHYIILFLRATI